MTLSHLSLAQFRSWARLELDFDRRPMAIFGPNGSGKTNILEAVSLLSPGRGLRSVSAAEFTRDSRASGWRIRAQLGDQQIETSAVPGQSRQVLIDEKPQAQSALGRIVRLVWLVPAMDRLWSDPPETRRRFLDRVTLSLFPDHAELSLSYEKAMRERNRLLKDQVADPGWYRVLEAQMAQAGAALTGNRQAALTKIMSMQDQQSSGFPSAVLTLLPGEGYADDADDDSIALRLESMRARDLAAGRSLTGPHRADLGAHWGPNQTNAASSSTGEQKALLLSFLLANARALAEQPVILLLDEVAAHLDAGRRALLYDQVVSLPALTLLTGTGPELFEDLDSHARRLLVCKTDGTSSAEEV